MKLYDKEQIDSKNILFDNKALFSLLLPIIVEQFLNSLMGMADTMMVSTVGSYAISAVSLVDSINNLVIQIFAAMAAGAVIICSQYIGGGNREESNKTAGQVVLTVLVISLSIMAFCILGGERLLGLIFGTVVIYYCLRKPRQTIVIRDYLKIRPDMALILKIMAIGIPAGLENGMFQFGKIAIASTVSTMGTIAMSAQAMTIAKPLLWVGAFGLPYGFKAAGDVKFSMIVSVSSMWCCRVAFCIFLVRTYHLGLWAVWIGIFTDWIVRASIFSVRFINGRWIYEDLIRQK